MTLALLGILLFTLGGAALIWKRNHLASMQSMLAGGAIRPGCVVAEGIVLLAIAAAIGVAWRYGLFAE